MIICHACIGDLVAILYAVQSLDPKDELPRTYQLMFQDLPTGENETLVYTGENDAVLAFAAWLAADAPEDVIKACKQLRARIKSKGKFLP